jgi:hypothetical protein
MPLSAQAALGGSIISGWPARDGQNGLQKTTASVVDGSGNTYITGYQNLSDGTGDNFYTIKIKPNGSPDPAWTPQAFDLANGEDRALAITVDTSNDVYVTGYATKADQSKCIYTIKYSGTNGAKLWENSYTPASGSLITTMFSIALDGSNLYVAGNSRITASNDDILILKFNASGTSPNTPTVVTYDHLSAARQDNAVSIDARGGKIAVTGLTYNGTRNDMLTLLYNSSLSLIQAWQHTSTGGNASGRIVKIDSAGNVIASGYDTLQQGTDIYTVKYDGSATPLWENRFQGQYDDMPTALVVDSHNDVYITGTFSSIPSYTDFYTARIDGATGLTAWQMFYDSGSNVDVATGIVVDESGDVYVTGYSKLNGSDTFQSLKYKKDSSTGSLLWQKNYGKTQDGNVVDLRPVGIGVSAGGVHAAGWATTVGGVGTGYDYYALMYEKGTLDRPAGLTVTANSSSSLHLAWISNSSGQDGFEIERCAGRFCTFAPLDSGFPVSVGSGVSAYDDSSLSPNTYYNYRVRAYKGTVGAETDISDYSNTVLGLTVTVTPANPDPSNIFMYDGTDHKEDTSPSIAVGPDNNPVVTGYSYYLIDGLFNYYTVKLDKDQLSLPAGKIWGARYDNSLGNNKPSSVAVDGLNNVIVTGTSVLPPLPIVEGDMKMDSLYTLKYLTNATKDGAGEITESAAAQYNGPDKKSDQSTQVVIDKSDGNNNFVVIGHGKHDYVDNHEYIFVVKYDTNGSQLWEGKVCDNAGTNCQFFDAGPDGIPTAAAVAPDGSVYVTGQINKGTQLAPNFDYFTLKFCGKPSSQTCSGTGTKTVKGGQLIWSAFYDSAHGNDYAKGVAVDSLGDVYVTGTTALAGGKSDFYTIKYDGANNTQAIVKWSGNGLTADGSLSGEAVAIAVDPNNNDVIIAGNTLWGASDSDFTIARYKSDGSFAWTDSDSNPIRKKALLRPNYDDRAVALGLDMSGNIYVAGNTTDAYLADGNDGIASMAVMFNPNGDIKNATTYNASAHSPKEDKTTSLAVNSLGEAFIAGTSNTGSGGTNNLNYLVYKIPKYKLQAPSQVTVTSTTYLSANLSWKVKSDTSAAGVTGYRIKRADGQVCANDNIFVGGATPTIKTILKNGSNPTADVTYADNGADFGALTQNTNYCYAFQSYHGNQTDPDYEETEWVPVKVTTANPVAPVLTATVDNTTQITLAGPVTTSGQTSFEILRCSGAGCTPDTVTEPSSDLLTTIVAAGNEASVSYQDTTACPGITYRYQIRVKGSGWKSAYGTLVAATANAVPTASLNLNANTYSESQINLSWTRTTSDENGYRIWRCPGKNGEACPIDTNLPGSYLIDTVSSGITTYASAGLLDPGIGLAKNATFTHMVTAFKAASAACGYSGNEWRIDSAAINKATQYTAPTISVTFPNTTQATIAWTDTTTAESAFTLQRCITAGCNFTTVDSGFPPPIVGSLGKGSALTYADTSVCATADYQYRLKPVNSGINTASGSWNKFATLTISNFKPDFLTRVTIPGNNASPTPYLGMKDDFSDIRIYDETAKKELPYWIENKSDRNWATVWFKTGSSPKISLYYDNSNATNVGNIANVFGSGVMGFFPFGEGATSGGTTYDKSGLGNDLTLGFNGGYGIFDPSAAKLSPDSGNVISNDGTRWKYASRGTATLPTGSTASIEAWIYPKSPQANTYNGIVSFGENLSAQRLYLALQDNGRPATYGFNNDFVPGPGAPQANFNAWNHIAVVLDGTPTTTATLYMNGVPVSSPLSSTANLISKQLYMGADNDGIAFKGYIDDVRIYNRALTAADIAMRYAPTLPTVTVGAPSGFSGVFNGTWGGDDTYYGNTLAVHVPAPAVVTGLNAVANNEAQVTVSWTNKTADQTGFKIFRCTGASCDFSSLDAGYNPKTVPNTAAINTVVSHIDITGLVPGVVYKYKVVAYKTGSGVCAWDSAAVTSNNVTMPLNAPTGLVKTYSVATLCNDLRFTNSGTTTSLPYWIEFGCNTYRTKVHVNTQTYNIPKKVGATDGSLPLFLYYGNSTAPAKSSGTATFDFFDDFTGSAIDTSKWTVAGVLNTDYSIGNGLLHGVKAGFNLTSNLQWSTGKSIQAKAKACGFNYSYGMTPLALINGSNKSIWSLHGDSNIVIATTGVTYTTASSQPPAGMSVYDNIIYTQAMNDGTTVNLASYDAEPLILANYFVPTPGSVTRPAAASNIYLGADLNGYTGYDYCTDWDWVRVRKTSSTVGTYFSLLGPVTLASSPGFSVPGDSDKFGVRRTVTAGNNGSSDSGNDWQTTFDSINPSDSGTATSGTTTTLTDGTKAWAANQWGGYYLKITSGANNGLTAPIISNTGTVLILNPGFANAIGSSSYQIITASVAWVNPSDSGTAASGSTNSLTDTGKAWVTNQWIGFSLTMTSGANMGLTTLIQSNTPTILTLSPSFASNIINGDKYLITWGATGTFLDTTPLASDQITLTWTNSTVSETGYVIERCDNSPTGHNGSCSGSFVADSRFTMSGTGLASYTDWSIKRNNAYCYRVKTTNPIWPLDAAGDHASPTSSVVCDVARSQSAPVLSTSGSTTQISLNWTESDFASDSGTATAGSSNSLTDANAPAKAWGTNQWIGFYLKITSGTKSGQYRQITSNTNNSVTVAANFSAAVASGDQYQIVPADGFGKIVQGIIGEHGYEIERCTDTAPAVTSNATAATTTTLTDSGKSWSGNQWNGYFLKITSGANSGLARFISGNSGTNNNTITFTSAFPNALSGTESYQIISGCTPASQTYYKAILGPNAARTLSDPLCSASVNDYWYRLHVLKYGPDGALLTSSNSGWPDYSEPVLGSIISPPAPSLIKATSTSETQITLSWKDNNSDESGFYIYRCTDMGGATCTPSTLLATVGVAAGAGTTVTYVDSKDIAVGATYRYRVISFGSGATCPWTSPFGTPDPALYPSGDAYVIATPVAPGLAIANNNTTQVNVSWADNTSSEGGFLLERCTGAGCTDFSYINNLLPTTTSRKIKAFYPFLNNASDISGNSLDLYRTPLINAYYDPLFEQGGLHLTNSNSSYQNIVYSVLDSGTATTSTNMWWNLADSNKTWVADQWKGYFLKMTSGVSAGKMVAITTNTPAQLTLSDTFGNAIVVGDTYQIYGGSTDILDSDTHGIEFDFKIVNTNAAWRVIFGSQYSLDATNSGFASPSVWLTPSAARLDWVYTVVPNSKWSEVYIGKDGLGSTSTPFDLNTWYHVRGEKAGSLFKVYVNGNLIGTQTVVSPQAVGNSPIVFGANKSTAQADIVLKNFQIDDNNMSVDSSECAGTTYSYRSKAVKTGFVSARVNIANYLPNFQTRVVIPASIVAGRTAAQINDLRFYDYIAKADIPYWIETVNSDGSATVWIKTGDPYTNGNGVANTNTITLYANKNATGATSASDATKVFDFFDDFNYSSAADPNFTARWGVSVGGTATVSSGRLGITVGSVYSQNTIGPLTTPLGRVFEMKNSFTTTTAGGSGISVCNSWDTYSGNGSPYYAHADLRFSSASGLQFVAGDGSVTGWNLTGSLVPNSYMLSNTGVPANMDTNIAGPDRISGIEYQDATHLNFFTKDPATYALQYFPAVTNYANVWNPSGPTAPYILLGHIWGHNAGAAAIYPISVEWVRVRKSAYPNPEPLGTIDTAVAFPQLDPNPGAGGSGSWTASSQVVLAGFQPNYQTRLIVSKSPLMNSDYSDLRFYDTTAGAELAYYIESYTSTTATLWIKTGNANSIAMYYGNPNAKSTAVGAASMFDFYDDFTTLDAAKWSKSDPGADITVDGSGSGTVRINSGALVSKNPVLSNPQNYAFEMKAYWLGSANVWYSGLVAANANLLAASNGNGNAIARANLNITNNLQSVSADGTTSTNNLASPNIDGNSAGYIGATNAGIIGFGFPGSNPITFFSRNPDTFSDRVPQVATNGTWKPTNSNTNAYLYLGHVWGMAGGVVDITDLVVDWVRVRRYAYPEPQGSVDTSQFPANLSSAGAGNWTAGSLLTINNFQPNFQTPVPITATMAKTMKSDLSDIRFYDTIARQELPYWVEGNLDLAAFPNTSAWSGANGGSWTLREPVNISNFSANALTRVVISASSLKNMKPDLSDLRFYDYQVNAQIPFWIQKIDTNPASATVWIKTGVSNKIAMYYGNSSAISGSSTNSAFFAGTGLVGYWPFDEAAGITSGTTADVSGSNLPGTLTSSATILSGGRFGNGLSLNGTSNYVSVTDGTGSALDTITTAMTIDTWVNFDTTTTAWSWIAGKQISYGGTALFRLYFDDGLNCSNSQKRVRFVVNNGTTGLATGLNLGTCLTPGWHHVVGRFNSTEVAVFIDGVKETASIGTGTAVTLTASNEPLAIGITPGGTATYTKGTIDEVCIFNKALLDAEILSSYTQSSVAYPQVWVKTGANNSIAMYYGNANASSMSSGANTFEFFDDFKYSGLSDSSFTSRWSLSDPSANISLDGTGTGKLRINSGAVYSNAAVVSNPQNYVYELKNQWLAPIPTGAYPAGITLSNQQYFLGGNAGFSAYVVNRLESNGSFRAQAGDSTSAANNVVQDYYPNTSGTTLAALNSDTILGLEFQGTGKISFFSKDPITYADLQRFTKPGSVSITDTSKTWTANALVNKKLVILTGRNAGQSQTILSNTANSITVYAPVLTPASADTSFSYFLTSGDLYQVQNADGSFNDKGTVSGAWNSPSYLFLGSNVGSGIGTTGGGTIDITDQVIDWVRIRKSASPMPTVTVDAIGVNQAPAPEAYQILNNWSSQYSPVVTVITPQVANLVSNPDFETGLGGWSVGSGASEDGTAAASGTKSMKISKSLTKAPVDLANSSEVFSTALPQIVPGGSYTLTGNIKANLTNGYAFCRAVANNGTSDYPLGEYSLASSPSVIWNKTNNTIPAGSDSTSTDGRIPLGTSTSVVLSTSPYGTPTDRGDSGSVQGAAVIKEGATYRMWYSGNDHGTGGAWRIYYATSSDGLDWTKVDASLPPVQDAGTVPTNNNGRLGLGSDVAGIGDRLNVYVSSAVIKDVQSDNITPIYKMWYTGHDRSNWRIYYATSPDGLNWTKYDNTVPTASNCASGSNGCTNGRIPLGLPGSGDSTHTYAPTVVKEGTTYKMWYSGHDGSYFRIYYAYSTDGGLTWTKQNTTATVPRDSGVTPTDNSGQIPLGSSGKGDDNAAQMPHVVWEGGTNYRMWYAGQYASAYNNPALRYNRILTATSTDGGLNWKKLDNTVIGPSDTTSGNSQITYGNATAGDAFGPIAPFALKEGVNTYTMWYSGIAGAVSRIYRATTTDNGSNWLKTNNAVPGRSDTAGTNGRIPQGTTGAGDTFHTAWPSVIQESSNSYKMWYSGSDGANWRLYYATSSDGLNWTKFSSTVPAASDSSSTLGRLPIGTAGKGDGYHVLSPSVIKEDATHYKMWYCGHDGINWRGIYQATSSDGVNWTKTSNTTFTAPQDTGTGPGGGRLFIGTSGDSRQIRLGSIVWEGGLNYKMWYGGYDGSNWRIYLATSTDGGLTWNKTDNSPATASDTTGTNGRIPLGSAGKGDSNHVYNPAVYKDGSTYKMWYAGADGSGYWRIFYATSPDGLTWTKQDNTLSAPSDSLSINGRIPLGNDGKGDGTHVSGATVIKDGSVFKMWYAAYDQSVPQRVRILNAIQTTANLNDNQWHSFSLPISLKTSLPAADTARAKLVCGIARDNSGTDGTDTANFDMIQLVPANPFNLTTTVASESQINLAWSNMTKDESGFRILRCPTASDCTNQANYTQIATTAAGATSFQDTSAQLNTSYKYEIAAFKNSVCGWGAPNNVISTASAASTNNPTPTLLTAKVVNTTQVDLSWNDNSQGETGFAIERKRSTDNDNTFAPLPPTVAPSVTLAKANATTYSDLTVCPATDYVYRIRPLNKGLSMGDNLGAGPGINWTKKKLLSFTGFQPQFQVAMTIANTGMKADFSDLRFFDAKAQKELPYWIEWINGNNAKVWLKTGANQDSIYMYYGNPTASASTRVAEVFEFFDDFTGNGIDWSKWDQTNSNSTGFSVSGGYLHGTNTTGQLNTLATYPVGYSVEYKAKTSQWPDDPAYLGGFNYSVQYYTYPIRKLGWVSYFRYRPSSTLDNTGAFWPGAAGRGLAYINNYAGLRRTQSDFGFNNGNSDSTINVNDFPSMTQVMSSDNMLYRVTAKSAANTSYHIDEMDRFDGSGNPIKLIDVADNSGYSLTGSAAVIIGGSLDNPGQSYAIDWDWVRVRKYVAVEPTISFGPEISASGADFTVQWDATSSYSNNSNPVTTVSVIAPSNLAVTEAIPNKVNVSWLDNTGDETGFEIWDCLDSSYNKCTAATVPANTSTYTASANVWSRRVPVTFSNFQQNFPIRVTITVSDLVGVKSDLSDIRFFDTVTTPTMTELPYWIERVSGGTATVWVKTGANSTNNSIYLYYGNTNAASVSNKDAILGANLVAFWPFEETAPKTTGQTLDVSGSNLSANLSANFAAGYGIVTGGKYGNALKLNPAASNYISVSDSTSSPVVKPTVNGGSLTAEMWYYYDGSANTKGMRLLSKLYTNATNDYTVFSLHVQNQDAVKTLVFLAGDPTNKIVANDPNTSFTFDGKPAGWYHLVGRYDANQSPQKSTLFVNNVPYAGQYSANANFTLSTSNETITIGCRKNHTGGIDLCAPGMIDDVRIYNRALSDAEISARYAATPPLGTITAASAEMVGHCYSVRAIKAGASCGWPTAYSSVACINNLTDTIHLDAVAQGPYSVNLFWNNLPLGDTRGFDIEKKLTNGKFININSTATSSTNSLTYLDKVDIEPLKQYTYRVRKSDKTQQTVFSDSFPTGINTQLWMPEVGQSWRVVDASAIMNNNVLLSTTSNGTAKLSSTPGKLEFYSKSNVNANGTVYEAISLNDLTPTQGDFDVQLDYAITKVINSSTQNSNNYVLLRYDTFAPAGYQYKITLYRARIKDTDNVMKDAYVAQYTEVTPNVTYKYIFPTSDLSGKLRIARTTGSDGKAKVSLYTSSGGAWDLRKEIVMNSSLFVPTWLSVMQQLAGNEVANTDMKAEVSNIKLSVPANINPYSNEAQVVTTSDGTPTGTWISNTTPGFTPGVDDKATCFCTEQSNGKITCTP